MSFTRTWTYKFLRALDVFACGLLFRDTDTTISADTGLELRRPEPALWARLLGAVLNWIQPGHCEMAIQDDLAQARETITRLEG